MSIKQAKLNNVANIRQGYQFRKKIDNNQNGNIPVIQMTDIISNKEIDYLNVKRVKEINHMAKHFIQKGEILFCARGSNNYAVLIEDNFTSTIAASQFHIINVNEDVVDAGYLTWFLHQQAAINYFKTHTLVSTVPLINKSTLENLMVPPLSIKNLTFEFI